MSDTPREPVEEPGRVGTGAHVLVEEMSFSYKSNAPLVLDNIDFEVSPGEIVSMIGRSGSGKSTLLHLIAGLTKPRGGAAFIDGNRVLKPSRRSVIMFQSPSLYPWMSVAENAALGLRFARRGNEAATRVPEVLSMVSLQDYADRNVQDLSGGQQQRVALARSLAPSPDLLMLDEPFSALDVFTRRTLQKEVRQIARRLGLTLLVVTHDVSEAVMMADRVAILASNPGRIVDDLPVTLSEVQRDHDSAIYRRDVERVAARYAEAVGDSPENIIANIGESDE